jgi:ribosomal protein L11 methyltransferase
MSAATGWRAAVVVPGAFAGAFAEALEAEADAAGAFEVVGTANWCVEAYFAAEPDRAALQARLLAAALAVGLAVPALELAPLLERDWVTETLHKLPPVRAGRFFIHGAHDRDAVPAGTLALEIEAGRAFGTGQHESTRGCLLAIDRLTRARRWHRPLDLGCGSGVLTLALAKCQPVPVTASDIDPWAVRVTQANARHNGLGPWIRAVVADGLDDPVLAARAPFDLIVANILARPLRRLAPALARSLAAEGRIVLSGLLRRQERLVLNAYLDQGLALERRIVLGDWSTLVLRRRGSGRRSSQAALFHSLLAA